MKNDDETMRTFTHGWENMSIHGQSNPPRSSMEPMGLPFVNAPSRFKIYLMIYKLKFKVFINNIKIAWLRLLK